MPSALTILFLTQLPQTQHLPAPKWGVAPGGAVTAWCECRCRGARVLLYKAGDPEARQGKDPPEDVAQFSIHNVSQRDAGSYSCRYSIKSDLSVWSEPRDTMEQVVAEGTDPAGPQQPDPPMMEPEGEGPGVRWFYARRGNRPDPAWNGAGSHPPEQHRASPVDTSAGLEAADSGPYPKDKVVDEEVKLEDDVGPTAGSSGQSGTLLHSGGV
ncbi:unnamed protein product [Natator depressus]